MTCARCGQANRAGARFCDACGAPLAAAAGAGAARKVVTIVFADLIGSTALHERLDAESARAVMDRYYQALRGAVAAHGGTVVKLLGDGVMAAFGVPRVAEDDAVRAVRAAAAMQSAFRALRDSARALSGDVGLRVAVNTGEVVVSTDQSDVVGDPVNVAARLQQEAGDGDVLLGESTRRLVADQLTLAPVGALALRGRAEAVDAHRLVSLERPLGAAAAPFVGRDDELRRLRAAYDEAVASRRARLAVVLGSPGLGKSRLVDELGRRLGAAAVLAARCDAAGAATFAPLAAALRAHLGLDEAAAGEAVRAALAAALPAAEGERARVVAGVAALLAGAPAAPEETFFAVRRLLAGLAVHRPLVLAIDDAQWAEPLLLDLVEHLAQWGDAPLLLLLAARPELRELRPALAVPAGLVREVMTLAGLDAGAATRLAASVVGADELPAAIAGRVLAASEGNPLFVGELVRMLVANGALRREGERWTAGVAPAALEMPPTIHALLAARVERLRPEPRAVLERAAVIGRSFSRAAVAALLPAAAAAALDAHLEALRRGELIEPDPAPYLGEPGLRFHHALIRDAAYRRLLKGTRAELHGGLADWIAGHGGAAGEHDEVIGWHLEQAHRHLLELGPLDARARALGTRAAERLAAAGRRALARDDLSPAAALLGRALARLEPEDAARADLALDWCEALLAAGAVGPAAPALAELGRFATAPRLGAWHACFAGQLAVLTTPQDLHATADAVAAAAATLAAAGDAAGEAKAHAVHATALARLGAIGASEAALDRALAAARRGGDRRRASAVLAGAPLAALWGPSPVTRASGRCLDIVRVLRITQGAPAVEAVALRCQAVLEALRGRIEAARRMIAASRRLVEQLGITHRLLEAEVFAGVIELLQGDAVAAERCLGPAYEGLRAQGLGVDAARAAASLGRALLTQGRVAEAEALSRESQALAGDDLQAAIAWRGVRAEALARRGEHAEAVALARAAVEIAAATDALLDHADARQSLAAALRAAGREAEAAAEAARAVELWEAKGAVALAARARGSGATGGAGAAAAVPALSPAAPARFENAALRTAERMRGTALARDADAFRALLAPRFRSSDRQAGVQLEVGRDEWLAGGRAMLQDLSILEIRHQVLATRGDRLSLLRVRWTVAGETVGRSELDWMELLEVDADGRAVAWVAWDADQLDAAHAELDARYAAGESAPFALVATAMAEFRRALAARDWEALAAVLSPDLVMHDHRPLGWELTRGPRPYIDALRALVELAPDVRLRLDHADVCANGYLALSTWVGAHEGGAFETPSYIVGELDDAGRAHRFDQYDLDQLPAAQARWAAVRAGSSIGPPPGGTAARRSRR